MINKISDLIHTKLEIMLWLEMLRILLIEDIYTVINGLQKRVIVYSAVTSIIIVQG